MKKKLALLLLVAVSFSFTLADIGASEFYDVLGSSSIQKVDNTIVKLKGGKPGSKARIYRGALIVKKADFVKEVKKKISLCKEGIAMIEAEISRLPSNVEYRFIRLTIQENVPGVLKYKKNIEEDRKMILNGYRSMNPVLKRVIRNYAKSSKTLSTNDLPG